MTIRLLILLALTSVLWAFGTTSSALAIEPYVDLGLTHDTPLPDADMVIVRERFYGAEGVDLAGYGLGVGTETFVQSLYFRLFVDNDITTKDFYSGLIVLPASVTILGVITDRADLGGSASDGVFTASDTLFGVGAEPDNYSASQRGFETSGSASGEYIGIIDSNSLAFAVNVNSGLDDFRLIIDYGDSVATGLSFDVLAMEATPPASSVPLYGFRIGDAADTSVFGSGDYGEAAGLQGIPLTAAVGATPAAILPFQPDASLYLARDPSNNTSIDAYDTELNVPLPGQFLLDNNVSNPRGVTEHTNGMIYCSGRDGGFAVIDPVARTVSTTLMANLPGDNVDATNLPGHGEIFVVRNPTGPTQIDAVDPNIPAVINSFGIAAPNTPVAIVAGTDGLLYVLGRTGVLSSVAATGDNYSSVDLNPATGNYDGMTARLGTDLLYLVRDTSGDTMIDVYDITTGQITFDLATLAVPAAPADITDGPNDLLYIIGDGQFGPAGYTVVDPVSGLVIYATEYMDFTGVYRSLTARLPQPAAVGDTDGVPAAAVRHLAWPNPFNPRVEISYELARAAATRVRVLDVRGRLVRVLRSGEQGAGWHVLQWDGLDRSGKAVPSGTYLYQISSGAQEAVGKMVLVR